MRLLAAELGPHQIRVNGINPDGVVRGSGIFAGGWGASRAAVYGVEEEELGEFYAQRTLLKREVLPEHVADAVFALTGGDLDPDDGAARAGRLGRRRRLPADEPDGTFAAVDLGASSGRVMVARVGPDRLELHRGAPVRQPAGAHRRAACTGTCWALYAGVLDGLRAAGRDAGRLDGIGIDSWAVDYGLLDADGALLGNPLHYRDAAHEAAVDAVHAVVPAEELYRVSGLQHLPFNTVFQLAARRGSRPARRPPAGCCWSPTCWRTG